MIILLSTFAVRERSSAMKPRLRIAQRAVTRVSVQNCSRVEKQADNCELIADNSPLIRLNSILLLCPPMEVSTAILTSLRLKSRSFVAASVSSPTFSEWNSQYSFATPLNSTGVQHLCSALDFPGFQFRHFLNFSPNLTGSHFRQLLWPNRVVLLAVSYRPWPLRSPRS